MEVLALPDFQGSQRLKITLQISSLNYWAKNFSQHFAFMESYGATGNYYTAALDNELKTGASSSYISNT